MADKKINITLDIGANISQVKSAINTLRGDFEKLGFDKGTTNIQNLFKNLDSALLDLEKKSNTALTGLSDARGVERSIERVTGLIRTLGAEITELGGKTPEALSSMVDRFSSKMKQAGEEATNYNKRIKEIDDSYKNLTSDVSKIEKKITGFTEEIAEEEVKLKEETKAVAEAFEKLNNLQTKKSGIQKQIQSLNSDLDKQKQKLLEYATDLGLNLNSTGTALTTASKQALADLGDENISQTFQQVEADIIRLTGQIKVLEEENGQLASSIKTATSEYNKLKGQQSKTELGIKTDKGQLDLAQKKLQEFQQAMEKFNASSEKTGAFEEYKNKLSQIFGDETLKNAKNVEELRQKLQQLSQTTAVELKNGLEQVLSSLKQTSPELEKAGDKARGVVQEYKGFNEANHEIEMLTSRLKYFFSLIGGFQLMRRAVRSAIDTTKELDEVMTQTAVVSNYTVGDMWKTLPQYSKYAKQLGAEIKDVYGAQTLYVQQGLNMNAAMDLGIETLKMARVAGIEASEATNSMTAALRGFNMELTETSAIRINDVYSKLAQNTASNVQEISTAMTKTAALANSANMSFENTASYLAKIIESTREGAETAGTALKTVIARFTEVKKLYSEGELTGTDEEGEEIDVNKISAALRTVGINMNEFFTGAVGLDDIFDQLGRKWDSLTTVQQRYIATMAAGSRQQSRFLALMQNYNRTVELTEMAYNSAGSGQEQFEKTLESLEVKIHQLKAAWDTFTMGIANSDFIKGVIDAGTNILELLNSIIDKISGGNGAVKSVLSLATVFGIFKASGAVVKGGLSKVGTLIGAKGGLEAGTGFISKFSSVIKQSSNGSKMTAAADFLGRNFMHQLAPTVRQATSYIADDFWKSVNVTETFKGKGDLFKEFQLGIQTQDIEKVNKALKDAGSQVQITQSQMNALGAATNGLQLNFNAVANSALMFGGILVGLGTYLESLGGQTGEVGSVVKKVGISLIACGAAFKVAAAAAQAFGVSLYEIPYIGWIAAAITVIVAAITAWSAATEDAAEKTERLNKASEESVEGVKKVKSEYEDLMSKIDSISKEEAGLDKLTAGTEEWNTAVENLNQSILELIKLYPGLADAVQYTNGRLGLDMTSKAYQDYIKNYKARVANGVYAEFGGALGSSHRKLEEGQEVPMNYELDDKTLQNLFYNHSLKEALHYWADEQIKQSDEGYVYNYNIAETAYGIKTGQLDAVADLLDSAVQSGYITQFTNVAKAWEEFDSWLVDSGLYNAQAEGFGKGTTWGDVLNKEITYDVKYNGTSGGKETTTTTNDIFNLLSEMFTYDRGVGGVFRWEDYTNALTGGLTYEEGLNTLATYAATNVMDTAGLKDSKFSSVLYQLARQLYKNQYNAENVEIAQKDFVDFAESIGGKYENGEVYTSEGTKITENAKYYKAGKNAEAKAAVQLATIGRQLSSLNPEEISTLLGLVENRKNLTLSQMEGLTAGTVSEIGGFSLEEIANFAGIKATNNKTAKENLIADVQKIYDEVFLSLDGLINKDEIESQLKSSSFQTAGQATLLSQQVKNVALRGGNIQNFLDNIFGLEKTLESQLPAEKLETAKNIIASTDFSNIDAIDNTISELNKLGANIGKGFTDQIINASKAVNNFSTKKIEEQISSLEEGKTAAQKIENGEYTLTNKEYTGLAEILRKQNPEKWDNDWVRTGLNEWTYVGEETNSLLGSIDACVRSLLEENIKEANEAVKRGEIIQKSVQDNQEISVTKNGEIEQVSLEDFFGNVINENGQINEEYAVTSHTIDQIALAFGIDPSNYSNLDFPHQLEFLKTYWDNNYGIGGSAYQSNIDKVAGLQTYAGILPYEYTSAQSVINDTSLTQEEKTQTLENSVKKLNAGEQYMAQQDIAKIGKDFSNVINALTVDAQKADKRFDSLTQTYKDNADALKTEKKGSREYGLALANLTKTAKTAFNNNDKITEDFVDKHLDLFKDYAEGVDGAEDNIREAMFEDGVIEGTQEQVDALKTAIDGIDDEELSINGTANFSSAFAMLAELYGSAEAAAEKIRSLGYSVTWEPAGTTTMKMPDGTTRQIQNYKAVVQDAAGKIVNNNKGGGGGGGGGGGKEFKNDFDKYYNMVEDINELQRLRNLLETNYQQLLNSEEISGKAIYDNLKRQVELLKERRDITADLAEKRKQQIIDEVAANQDLQKYAWWNEDDLTIEINWDLINTVKDSEQGSNIKDYVSKLEDFQSKYDEQIEALEEIETTLKEIEKRGREQYTSLEDRTRDALIKQIQDKIDELNSVNDSINNTNQKLFDSIQETLELQRQTRDNAKTEENLADKEQRLAYLRQDSSNANALEIAKLEEELANERQSYTDTLIDQKISELQKQNDKAQEQRQQQIELMQQSLDWQEKSGSFWQQAYNLIQEGTSVTGQLVHGSELESLLKGGEAWDTLSQEGKMKWLEELENTVAQAAAFISSSRQLETIGTKEGGTVTFTNIDGQTLTGKVDKNGNVVVTNADGSTTTYKDVYQSYDGTYHTMETEKDAVTKQKPATSTSSAAFGSDNGDNKKPNDGPDGKKTFKQFNYKDYGDANSHKVYKEFTDGTETFAGTEGHVTDTKTEGNKIITYCKRCKRQLGYTIKSGGGGGGGKPNVVMAYASGGLNTQTGPAWLDGTPSKPELILNAKDTKNFIQLKDTLADVRKNNKSLGSNGGDNYYDIDIEVKEISSDYDVDQVATRVKTLIIQDGASRKVNTLSRLR